MNRKLLAVLVAAVMFLCESSVSAVPVFGSSFEESLAEEPAADNLNSEESSAEEEPFLEESVPGEANSREVVSEESSDSSGEAEAGESQMSEESAADAEPSADEEPAAAEEPAADAEPAGEAEPAVTEDEAETHVPAEEDSAAESTASEEESSEDEATPTEESETADLTGEEPAEESVGEESEAEPAEEELSDEESSEEELESAEEISLVGVTEPFAEGDYYIFSALAENVVLDIKGGLSSNGANLQLYALNKTDAQKFHVVWNEDGTATITAVHSGKALDAAGKSFALKTNVRQYTSNGTAAQKWVITEAALSGYYTIKASYTDMVFDAAGGSPANGTNVQLYTSNNTKAQQWKFVPVSDIPEVKQASISTGYYKLRMAKNAARCIEVADDSFDIGGNIALGPKSQEAAQVFYISNLGSGWYTIECSLTGYMFSSVDMTAANGKNIEQKISTGTANQKWYITECGGLYTIASGIDTKYVVDVQGGMIGLGTNIRLYESNDSIAQKWVLEEADEPTVLLPGGNYCITCASNAAMAVSVPAKEAVKGSNVALSTYTGNNFQKFIVTSFGDGTYKIIVAGSAMALDVAGGSKANGANVQQYTYNGTEAQRWKIIGCRGVYKLIGLGSGKAMDVSCGKIEEGRNIQMYTDNGTAAQRFCFTPVSTSSGSTIVTQENGKTYAVDPATGKKFQIEPEYLDDPRVGVDVTEDDFFAAVLYTEAGGQGTDGMLMVAYVILNRMAKGIEAARTGAYVEYPGTLDIMIYQKEQWQVARTKDNGDPAPLGNVLKDILHGTADYLTQARNVVALANSKSDIVLEHVATVYTKTGENTSSVTKMAVGTHIKAADFDYNSFMTPKAWLRYCRDGVHTKFKTYYQGNNAFIYSGAATSQGHVFFYDEEVW